MARLKANQRAIDGAAGDPIRRIRHNIEGVDGLVLEISPTGHRVWRVRTRDDAGARFWHTIGPATAITVGRAIDEAKKFVAAAKLGELRTTAEVTEVPRAGPTFSELFERWHAYTAQHKRGSSRNEDRRLFNKLIEPRLGTLRLGFAAKDRLAIISALDDIASEVSPIQANRAQAVISTTFSHARNEGLIDFHPATGIPKRGAEQSRSRDLTGAEIKAIWDGASRLNHSQRIVIRLLMLLGLRRSEVVELELREVDIANRHIAIRAERRKAWRIGQQKHPHIVPLGPASLGLIAEAQNLSRGSAFLFPIRTIGPDRPMLGSNVSSRFADLIRALNIDDCHLHDLRHVAKTGMTSLGVPPYIADIAQDQSPGRGSGKIYDRYQYLAERRRALELWENRLMEIVEGRPTVGMRW